LKAHIKIIGSVDDLLEWYINTKFMVAPIFDGSGMKAKVAEALMFGKRIIGTTEVFARYEKFINQAGKVCMTADEFVVAIKLECLKDSKPFYQELRNIYLENLSFNASSLRLKNILCD
jgi:glycosyltransferase involved in cell wall biosynthesis